MITIKSDDLFKKIEESQKNWKRISLGQKYGANGTGFDLYDSLEKYSGKEICNHRFNFLLEGNRCKECNAFSLLTHEGNILNHDIVITSGMNNGKVLQITKYNIDNKFGYYKLFPNKVPVDMLRRTLFVLPFIEHQLKIIENAITMINNDSNLSHSIVISNILKTYGISETDFLYMYKCDGLRVVRYKKENNVLVENLQRRDSLSILFNFIKLYADFLYKHNSFNISDFSFIKKSSSNKLSNTMRVNPTNLSSVNLKGYVEKKNIILLGNKVLTDYSKLPIIEYDVAIEYNNHSYDRIDGFPMLNSYEKMSIVIVRPSVKLFQYTESTGIHISDSYQTYMSLIMLLCNKFFHKAMIDFHMDIMKIMFLDNDINNVLNKTRECHNKNMSDQDIKNLAIKINFGMKLEISSKLLKTVEYQLSQL